MQRHVHVVIHSIEGADITDSELHLVSLKVAYWICHVYTHNATVTEL